MRRLALVLVLLSLSDCGCYSRLKVQLDDTTQIGCGEAPGGDLHTRMTTLEEDMQALKQQARGCPPRP
jgi:hypothetical protein